MVHENVVEGCGSRRSGQRTPAASTENAIRRGVLAAIARNAAPVLESNLLAYAAFLCGFNKKAAIAGNRKIAPSIFRKNMNASSTPISA